MLFTLTQTTQFVQEIKKSRFIVNAAAVCSPAQANEFIQFVSDQTASHNCWAWKIAQQYRFSDDGEPTSTAGRPILAAIEGQQCDQLVVVVTRFFGGIKLGTGGLIRAYGGSANRCLQQAPRCPIIARQSYQFHCLYSEWPLIEHRLSELDAVIELQTFDALGVQLQIALPTKSSGLLQRLLTDLTRGRVTLSQPITD